ncbi:MAG: hypothetical protein ABW061_20165 [Polyangiaceae bacterium]
MARGSLSCMLPPLREPSSVGLRPKNVPALAEWYFDSREWVWCPRDVHGELHGSLRAYRGDGTPSLEFEYRHGKRHGPFRRFHASGKLAQTGRYVEDVPDGLLCVYSDGESAYTIRECCIPAAARVMKQEWRRGQLLAEACYDAHGELLPAAEGAPGAIAWPQPLRERAADVLLSAYEFWPASEVLPLVTPDEPVVVEQPSAALREAIQRAGLRIQRLRAELLAQGAPQAPPDVCALLGAAPPLRRFSFSPEGDQTTLVHVDEALPSLQGAAALAAQARLEWTLLCWLCWAAGSSRVELPERIAPRPELYAALVHASERQAALSGPEFAPEARGHFHGLDETLLPASALQYLAEHYREIRAALLFVSDPECQSPWQDDLGRLSPSDRASLLDARSG